MLSPSSLRSQNHEKVNLPTHPSRSEIRVASKQAIKERIRSKNQTTKISLLSFFLSLWSFASFSSQSCFIFIYISLSIILDADSFAIKSFHGCVPRETGSLLSRKSYLRQPKSFLFSSYINRSSTPHLFASLENWVLFYQWGNKTE